MNNMRCVGKLHHQDQQQTEQQEKQKLYTEATKIVQKSATEYSWPQR
jgi:hypothetical protein